jgi:hypothetical protein
MRASVAVPRATTRARVLTRPTTSRRVVLARVGKPSSEEKGFFEADLANDLKSVSSDDIIDALRAGDALAYVGVGGLAANAVTSYSLYVLASTGCGLPPGPGGVVGAAEGVSYLCVAGFVLAATVKKFKTGSGLPAGPGGVLGGAEGVSFLVALVGLGVLANQLLHFGYVPEAVPVEGGQCFGK